MTDNSCSLIRLKSLKNLHLWSFMLIFKNTSGNTNQICHLGNKLIGAIFVYDFIFIGGSSTNSLWDFHLSLPLCFVVCSRKAIIKPSEFIKAFRSVLNGE